MRRLVTCFLVTLLLGAVAAPAAAQSQTATEPPATTVRSDILPGVDLTVEEVEPGVLRVLSDGPFDFDSHLVAAAEGLTLSYLSLFTGPDGSVWLARGDRLHRLGDGNKPARFREGIDLDIAPDSTIWQITKGTPYSIRSFDGTRWTTSMKSRKRNPKAIEIAPDGTVWAVWLERRRTDERFLRANAVLGSFDGVGWTRASRWVPRGTKGSFVGPGSLMVTDDGEIRGYGAGGHDLARYSNGSWEELAAEDVPGHRLEGTDGTVWIVDDSVLGDDQPAPDGTAGPFLSRVDRGVWQSWDESEVLPEGADWASLQAVEVAPDGALWASPHRPAVDESPMAVPVPDGLLRFDGTETLHVLTGRSIWAVEFGPDGAVWVVARRGPVDTEAGRLPNEVRWDLYVIAPEAVAE